MAPIPRISICFYDRKNGPGRDQAKQAFAGWLSCPRESLSYGEMPGGKPFLREFPEVSVGISHSGSILATYIGVGEAGIDLERMRPNRDFAGMAEAFFTPSERAIFTDYHNPEPEAFYRAWTKKEAFLKYTGKGFLGLWDAWPATGELARYWKVAGEYLLCLVAPRSILASVEVDSGGLRCEAEPFA